MRRLSDVLEAREIYLAMEEKPVEDIISWVVKEVYKIDENSDLFRVKRLKVKEMIFGMDYDMGTYSGYLIQNP